jgi:hypothetical protein
MLLLGVPIVYVAGGFIGLWISWHSAAASAPPSLTNSTTMETAGHVVDLLRMIYTSGHTPAAFQTGGIIALIVYVTICIIYVVVRFNTIASECSRSVDRAAQDDAGEYESAMQQSSKRRLNHTLRDDHYQPMNFYTPMPNNSDT